MKTARPFLAVVALLLLSGCYAASVDTGRPPSNTVIKKSFASCWLYGLIPPKTVETAAKCPNGVARVETQLSFVNQLVGALTLGIYTPMQIVVTCAEPGQTGIGEPEAEILLANDASPEEVRETFAKAADEAVRTNRPVLVRRI
jgi:hypothetical protein